jgi:hypothetical protein
MSSFIANKLSTYIAKVTLVGIRYVARQRQRREAAKAEAHADEEWWQDVLQREAEERRQKFHRHNEQWGVEVREHEEVMKIQDMELKELKEGIVKQNANPQDEVRDKLQYKVCDDVQEKAYETQDEYYDKLLDDALDEIIDEVYDEIYDAFHAELYEEVQGHVQGEVDHHVQGEVNHHVQDEVEEDMLQVIPSKIEGDMEKDTKDEIFILSIPKTPLQALVREVCIAGLGQEHDYTRTPLADWTQRVELPGEILKAAWTDPILQAQLERPLWVAWWADLDSHHIASPSLGTA